MDGGVQYRVTTAFLALRPSPDLPRFVTIPAGTVLTLLSPSEDSGFVDISYCGETVAAFSRDLEERCENVKVQAE